MKHPLWKYYNVLIFKNTHCTWAGGTLGKHKEGQRGNILTGGTCSSTCGIPQTQRSPWGVSNINSCNINTYSWQTVRWRSHHKTNKYMVVMGPSANRPPEGLRPNQVQEALTMMWGWHLRARLGCRHAPGNGMDQSRWPPWLNWTKNYLVCAETSVEMK